MYNLIVVSPRSSMSTTLDTDTWNQFLLFHNFNTTHYTRVQYNTAHRCVHTRGFCAVAEKHYFLLNKKSGVVAVNTTAYMQFNFKLCSLYKS